MDHCSEIRIPKFAKNNYMGPIDLFKKKEENF